MRHFILIIIIFWVTAAWAVEDVATVTDGSVIADIAGDDQAKEEAQDTSKNEYKSKYYMVKEETDIVEKALNVFKKKGKPSSLYRKKVWIYDALEEDNASFLSFTTNDQNADIVFSPGEDFAYYLEISSDGTRRLKGVKVGSQAEFLVDATVERFYIETCEDQTTSYLVVLDGEEAGGYYIYDLEGQSITLPDMPADVNDFKEVICY